MLFILPPFMLFMLNPPLALVLLLCPKAGGGAILNVPVFTDFAGGGAMLKPE
jgi:hypothetical protein